MTGLLTTHLAKELIEEQRRLAEDKRRTTEAVGRVDLVRDDHAFQRALVRASVLLIPGRANVSDRR
jgi:hypothetical protein